MWVWGTPLCLGQLTTLGLDVWDDMKTAVSIKITLCDTENGLFLFRTSVHS